MSKKILIKDRFEALPDPKKAQRIIKALPSADRERLERAHRAWWDPEKGLVVERRPSSISEKIAARAATDDRKALETIEIMGRNQGPPLYFHLLSVLGWSGQERRLDRSLQRLKKRGVIRYLKKADGGPGWSEVHKVEKKER